MITLQQTASFGTYTGTPENWEAVFTENGSSAIQSMSYNGETLTVSFASNPDKYYDYSLTQDVANEFYREVGFVVDGEGSIGKLFHEMTRSNKIQLI